MAHLSSLLAELRELLAAVDVDTQRDYDSAAAGVPLRQAVLTTAAKVGHEISRFTIVLRATRDESAIPTLVQELAAAVAALVSAVQLLTKPGACGSTLRHDARSLTKSCLRSLMSCFELLGKSSNLAAAISRHADEMLYHAGMVLRATDAMSKLPASDHAAVKRRLLSTAKLVKSSATEIAEEHEVDLDSLTANDPAPQDGAAPAATESASAPASEETSKDANSDNSEDDGDDGDNDEFDGEEGSNPALTGSVKRAFLRSGLLSFKAMMRLLKHSIAAVDALAPLIGTAQSAAPSDGGVDGITAALVSTTLNGGGAASSPLSPVVAVMDAVAEEASHGLQDAVIDAAAALNDLDAPALREALTPLTSTVSAIMSAAQAGRGVVARGTSHGDALEAALGEMQTAKEAVVRFATAAAAAAS